MRPLIAAIALLFLAATARAQTQPPSVVVFVLDDVGHEDMAIVDQKLGAAFSLTDVKNLAGRHYVRAYSTPSCSPSRYEIMTGLYQHRDFVGTALCVSCPMRGIGPERTTLPELLAVEGFATGLFGKAHYAGGEGTLQFAAGPVHGFERWGAGMPANIASHYNWLRIDDATPTQETEYSTKAVFDSFREWWTGTEGPKFAVVSPSAPHEPFEPPPASMLPPGWVLENSPRGHFEAALAVVDQQIIQTAAFLDLTNTYIFVVSDNGSPVQAPPPNGREAGYKLTVFEGGIRTPLYVFGPGILPGVDTQSLVQTVDLPATILDLVGVMDRSGFDDSISFAPALFGNPGARTEVFTQHFSPNDGEAPVLSVDDWAVIRNDGWKLANSGGFQVLFDLSIDPFEDNPLLPSTQPVIRDELLQLRAQILGPDWPY